MPLSWGWIAQAKQGDSVVINDIVYTEWRSTGLGELQTVATTLDGTIPAYYVVSTPDKTVRITFLNWQTTFDQKKNALKPPNNCPKKDEKDDVAARCDATPDGKPRDGCPP